MFLQRAEPVYDEGRVRRTKMRKNLASVLIVFLSLLLLAAGIWHGEFAIVLQKGVTICLECIGLG